MCCVGWSCVLWLQHLVLELITMVALRLRQAAGGRTLKKLYQIPRSKLTSFFGFNSTEWIRVVHQEFKNSLRNKQTNKTSLGCTVWHINVHIYEETVIKKWCKNHITPISLHFVTNTKQILHNLCYEANKLYSMHSEGT